MLVNQLLSITGQKKLIGGLLTALVAFSAVQASAVNLISDNRNVFFANDDGVSTSTPSAPFADWIFTNQTSSVSSDQFSGTGNGYGESDFFFSIQESTFDVTFSVDVFTEILLAGNLYGEDGTFGFGAAEVRLYAGSETSGTLLYQNSGGSGIGVSFDYMDILDAGVYRLIVNTLIVPGGFDTFADWSFTADFVARPVPVPAMGWLFGVLVFALARRKKH